MASTVRTSVPIRMTKTVLCPYYTTFRREKRPLREFFLQECYYCSIARDVMNSHVVRCGTKRTRYSAHALDSRFAGMTFLI